jgi:hypothetical protein
VAIFNESGYVGFGAIALCMPSNALCKVVSVPKSGTINCMLVFLLKELQI